MVRQTLKAITRAFAVYSGVERGFCTFLEATVGWGLNQSHFFSFRTYLPYFDFFFPEILASGLKIFLLFSTSWWKKMSNVSVFPFFLVGPYSRNVMWMPQIIKKIYKKVNKKKRNKIVLLLWRWEFLISWKTFYIYHM